MNDTHKIIHTLSTDRLIMREWRDSDLPSLYQMVSDPDVMEFFPSVLSEPEAQDFLKAIQDRMNQHGWGMWACELKSTQEVIGFVGLNIPKDDFYFNPCVEIGWRLRKEFWHQGLAQEAAREALKFGFTELNLDKIVVFTTVTNLPSQALMTRLNMVKNAQHFNHPRLAEDHPLAEHVLYELSKDSWLNHQR
ncbi:GNAT family N-acetyltransferase [Wohlfahrtiimonas populi]|uniref:GNAT family N-acetyltransferase n=1 Tax=Wohlfahrtiimonas populi TaxID=1940240 RepID=UPI00098D5667|nr:GNAT family N-acetyltransferase [Wohlfahrtiimonas populi]